MIKSIVPKLSILIGIVIISTTLLSGIYLGSKFYNNIFRLSFDQISNSLNKTQFSCNTISDCKLLPGDILIRRYITERTKLIDKLAHPYFTHSAFYLGNDQLIEAIGNEKNPIDDIQIRTLQESDWLNSDIKNFVIIRPKNYSDKLDLIKNNLKSIAEDPDYTFGIPNPRHKKTDCADLIFQQLLAEKIINVSNIQKMITPDYLFFVTKNDSNNFEIIGYNIQK